MVVGASLAGLRAVEVLRRSGFDGAVTVVGEETSTPTDRPPLSKQVLAGRKEPEQVALPAASADLGITWELGRRATSLDAEDRSVELDDGRRLSFDGLVIACGASPRTLPGTEGVGGVHTLRTVEDCLALRADLDAGPDRVVVVGAGFIGAEVAATCRQRGHEVTLLEALPLPLGRVLGDQIGQACADLHREHGVDLRTGVGVAGFEAGAGGRVSAVRLADGSEVAASVVVVGIGVSPNTSWLEGSGLALDDGVVCDETCVAAPGIVAAGDVARWPNRRYGELMRVEHWDNAIEQGAYAAHRLLSEAAGQDSDSVEPYEPVPWFWSDQHGVKIQLAGRCRPDDNVAVVQGSMTERRFVALYGRQGRVVGALGFSRPAPVVRWRARLAVEDVGWDEALAEAEVAQTSASAAP